MRAQLRGFTVMVAFIAASAALLSGLMAMAVVSPVCFDRFVRVIVAVYSADGVISSDGVLILQRVARFLIWAGALAAFGAGSVWVLLQRILRTSAEETPTPPLPWQPPRLEASWWPASVCGLTAFVLLVLAGLIRVPRLFTSLFYDEIVSVQRFASVPLLQIPFVQEGFNNHMLNSFFLHLMRAISPAEAVLRLPSFLAGLLSLWLLFRVGRDLAGPLAGLFAMWMAATNAYHLWYSTLARGYILGLAFMLAGWSILLRSANRPGRLARWSWGFTQVLASWAMPSLMLVSLGFLVWLLAGAVPSGRRLTGLDPRSPSGLAWLVTTLWVMTVIGVTNLTMIPFLVRLVANRDAMMLGGSALAAVHHWVDVARQEGLVTVAVRLALMVVGAAILSGGRGWRETSWPVRFFLALSAVSFSLFLVVPAPARVHGVAFASWVLLIAIGLRFLIMAVVNRLSLQTARGLAAAVLSSACLLIMTGTAWNDVTASARGTPLQDVRGAAAAAAALLPPDGRLLTSGWTDREIAYYADRPVQLLSALEDPSTLLTSRTPFCYFRLYGDPKGTDQVFNYFVQHAAPGMTFAGEDDSITVWCASRGKVLAAR